MALSEGYGRGISGTGFDRQVERMDDNALSIMQRRYWEAKQIFLKNIKKKEDECVVSSDADLDAKLELFRSIEDTCSHLLWALEKYQDRIWVMAHEESTTGRFLRDGSRVDTTRAGCMMHATGRTLSHVAQQRILLREPLMRLYKDVETFQFRAVTDTYGTIEKMEKARTAYRAALLWMKDVSSKLDPDAYKQLEKFRKVQAHVRRCKVRFEKVKVDTHQKIDMLCASRTNMLSHSLTQYQIGLLTFFDKTSQVMNAVSEMFVGFQYFESNLLNDLKEGKRQTVDDSERKAIEKKLDLIFGDKRKTQKDAKGKTKASSQSQSSQKTEPESTDDQLLDIKSPDVETPVLEQNPPDLNQCTSAPDHKQRSDDFLTDFDSSEKELLSELFALCEPQMNPTKVEQQSEHCHLPSQLVDEFSQMKTIDPEKPTKQKEPKPNTSKGKSATDPVNKWLNLFSELDPLANPDAVGKSGEDDRNC